jgi:hypothetical protein
MAIKLSEKTRVTPPDSTFPFGDIKDRTEAERGTPVNREVYGDFHQFFEKLMDDAEITHNGNPDNAYTGFQLFQALLKSGHKNFASDLVKALVGPYTTNDLIILWGCEISATVPGTSSITEGAIFYNEQVYKVPADASIITTGSQTLVFKIDQSTEPYIIYLDNAASGSGIANYNASTVKRKSYTISSGAGGTYLAVNNRTVYCTIQNNVGNKTNGQTIQTLPSSVRTTLSRTIGIVFNTIEQGAGSGQEGHCIPAVLDTQTGVITAQQDMATNHNIVYGSFSYFLD